MMKKRIFALLLSITLLISAVVTPVSAESINNFTVKVSDATATAGDDRVAVDILLEDNPGIAGFSFCVNYDTEKLVLVESKINIEDGYKVVAQPTGYGVNLAWTGPSGYSADGKIATLYFNIPKDLTASEANVDIVYRSGYDSFYDSHEHDIAVQTVNGKISIAALQETDKPSVNIGGVSVNFGATDIVVPITVNNNPGFSGFSFCVNYDTSRLVLESTNILLDGGYKVIGHPEGYGVNIAWTSTETYTEDGTIAELHFSLTDDPNSGKAYINTAFRDGYDSFYGFTNGTEQDIAFDAFNGYVDVNNHHFGEWVVTTPATCTATGLKTRTCSDCSKTETVVIPKVDHEYAAVVTDPTCTAKGYTTHTCKTCPDYYIDTYVDMVDHTLGEWEQSIAPECEVKGEEIQKCTVCKATINTRTVDETGHDFDDWYVVTEAKFNEDGQERRDCKNCDHFETKRIPKLSESHTCDYSGREEIIENATCTVNGSKKVFCTETECGKFEIVEIVALGHSLGDWYVVTEAKFNEDGQERRDCANCDYFETNRLPKLSESHVCNFTGREEIVEDATCTVSGSKKVYCNVTECGKYTTVNIDPTGHSGGEWEIKDSATCTGAGTKVKKCTVCGEELQSQPIDANGHDWDEGAVTTDPDCLNEGIKTFHCANCSETKTEAINATGHTEGEWNIASLATCTVAGAKEKRCTVCQALIATETIPATGHSLGDWYEYKKAEFHTDGEERKDCANCDYYESRRIPKLSESHICAFTGTEEIVSNPTCTQSGSKKVYCYEAACGKFTTVDIDPTGHTSGVWEVEKAATCTEAGTEVIKCTVCKTVLQSRGIEATGHSWDNGVVTKEANCLNEGEKTFTCSVCSAKDVKKIPTGGHTEGEWEVTDPATCTETGTKELHCTVCEQLLGTDTIAATGHKYGSWVVTTQPTATTAGEKSRECSVCHDVQTSPIDPTGELPKIVVSSTKGSVGSTVKVTISLQDNPGIITASLNVGYDATKLQLISAEDTGLLNDSVFSNDLTLNPYVMCWDDALATSNNSSNGEIVTLTFKVLQSDACKTNIVVTFEEDEIYDMNLDPVFFETQNGQVEIVDFIFGDVDGDGVCNIRDATILRRYVAKWDGVTVNELAADVNNDGIVNIRDATILRRHVAKWGGYEDLPYTA